MAVNSIDEYIDTHQSWEKELKQLHGMMLSTELKSAIKWGGPVYTLENKNVVGIAAFKAHVALWFFNGSLLKENTALLINAQEGKTKALRQIRFTEADKIDRDILLPYIKEAIRNQKEGRVVKPNTGKKKLIVPPELKKALAEDAELKTSFYKLTPGKQREYADHISEAKREATRHSRLLKMIPQIKKGVGLNDRYK
ncbi:YdeI/OmpD-associated family protein [Christiangramia salexigens]|uniref:YdhG-like domain-containing protein n=1 Tax=Christiangramia salexigens TaxID=1913577 RepID=A0A1L3J1A9_9FLAO|nr:YdeI/OmpD-associated family protein [Christiangramia salexigens]APG58912.1 hypothetical protein LPB144_00145 [Christiangramia salexigens]